MIDFGSLVSWWKVSQTYTCPTQNTTAGRSTCSFHECKVNHLPHQDGVLTATARRARKTQNDDRGARSGISYKGSPCHLHWTPWGLLGRHATACTKCAPWLGFHTAISMSAVGTPWVRNYNPVTAQWGLLERYEDAVRTKRGRIRSPL